MIDFHTHIYPDKIAKATIKKLSDDGRFYPAFDGTAACLKNSMEERKIELSVILPVATNPLPEKVYHLNEFASHFDGSDGLLSFGGVHPDCTEWKSELKHVKELGLKGIKIHPPYQGVPLNDVRYLRIMDEAASLGLIVISHMGYDIGLPGVKLCTPKMAADAVKQVGKFPFVLAHMGGWKDWKEALEVLPETGCYIDTAFSLGTVPLNQAAPVKDATPDYMLKENLDMLDREGFLEMVKAIGADHIIFGSDSPWDDPMRQADLIRSFGLKDEELEMIFSLNAKKLLG